MSFHSRKAVGVVLGLMFVAAVTAAAQESPEARSTGLPIKKATWTFNLDAGLGAFGFMNSLYTPAHPDPSGNLGDNWVESFVRPAISMTLPAAKGELYGKVSVVGERTFAAPPPLVGQEASSFQVEDLHLGWRSDMLDFTVGRAQYTIGHGLILWDGGGEGGTRGGFWSNARKAWQFAGIARIKPKNHTFEAFYLDRDEVPESETGTRVFGANYQLALGDATTLGATYMQFLSDSLPARDELGVFNVRAYTSPLKSLPGLGIEAEYALESNSLVESSAFNVLASYELSKARWKPRLSYRYAFFQGDDGGTTKSEAFDPLIPGFYDWGTWWQGEIAGEYFLPNSNLISHQVRLHVTPSESVSGGLFGYQFQFDQPAAAGATSSSVAFEIDGYADWKINSNFLASFIFAYAMPQDGGTQATGRTESFLYGMIYIAYSY